MSRGWPLAVDGQFRNFHPAAMGQPIYFISRVIDVHIHHLLVCSNKLGPGSDAVIAPKEEQGVLILALNIELANCSNNDVVVTAVVDGLDVAIDPGKCVRDKHGSISSRPWCRRKFGSVRRPERNAYSLLVVGEDVCGKSSGGSDEGPTCRALPRADEYLRWVNRQRGKRLASEANRLPFRGHTGDDGNPAAEVSERTSKHFGIRSDVDGCGVITGHHTSNFLISSVQQGHSTLSVIKKRLIIRHYSGVDRSSAGSEFPSAGRKSGFSFGCSLLVRARHAAVFDRGPRTSFLALPGTPVSNALPDPIPVRCMIFVSSNCGTFRFHQVEPGVDRSWPF